MAKTHDIRLQPTRDQRRELDRAAKAAGIRFTGPWVLSVALAAARVAGSAQSPSSAPKTALAPDSGDRSVARLDNGDLAVHRGHRAPLTRSFDPDAPG